MADEAKQDAKLALLGVAFGIWFYFTSINWLGATVIALFLSQAILLWKRQKAGVIVMIFTFLLAALFFAWGIYSKGFTITRGLGVACLLFGVFTRWITYRNLLLGRVTWDASHDDDDDEHPLAKDQNRRTTPPNDDDEEDDENKPLTSIVLLRRKPKPLDEKILLETIRDAWDEHRKLTEEDLFVAGGGGPFYLVRSPQGMWMVNNHPRSYFEGSTAPTIPDLRLRKVLDEHTAWLSVDLMHGFLGDLPLDVYYPYIFRLIRELADDDTLAILRPETGQINVWNEEVAKTLGSIDPLEEFATPVHSPVIAVSDEDPRMKAAIEEARRTFPTFREHWAARGPEDSLLVKAPIRDGNNSEIIWIHVTGLEPDYVHGTLANAPVNLEGYRMGDRVEIPVAGLYDWGIAKQGADAPLGLFTEKIVRAVEQEARETLHKPGPGTDTRPA